MKQRDIEGALALLMALSDIQATAKQLQELRVAKVAAEEAWNKAKQAQQVQQVVGDRLEADRKEFVRSLEDLHQREARLQEAEQQHQFTMDGQNKALTAQRDSLAAREQDLIASRKQALDDASRYSAELGQREKALEKRERDAQKVDEILTERERILKQGMQELADTKARLRELAA